MMRINSALIRFNLSLIFLASQLGMPLALAQKSSSDQAGLLDGSFQTQSVDEMPDTLQIPAELVNLAKTLLARTQATGNEFSACFKAESSGSWTASAFNEGDRISTKISKGEFKCLPKRTGYIHTHPYIEGTGAAPSDGDFINFLFSDDPLWLIAHKNGICALLNGSREGIHPSESDRLTPKLRYARHTLSASTQVTTEGQAVIDAELKGISGALRVYGMSLYCGASTGALKKVSHVGTAPKTDIMLAKGLIVMLKVSSHPTWPAMNFRFTPELDLPFVAYVNKLIGTDLTTASSPEEVVEQIFRYFYRTTSLYYGGTLRLPDPRLDTKGPDYLELKCDSTSGKRVCTVFSVKNQIYNAVSEQKHRIFALFEEGERDWIIEFSGMRPNDYQGERKDIRGIGYVDNSQWHFEGSFLNNLADGEGNFIIKKTGKRYQGTVEKNEVKTWKPY